MGSILVVFNLKTTILLVIRTLADLVVFIQNFIHANNRTSFWRCCQGKRGLSGIN